jgi:NADPH:quinone reductase-like Zn-dependent oxidoreductase
MHAVRLYAFGGAEQLVYEEDAPEPQVGAGEVKVRVRAWRAKPLGHLGAQRHPCLQDAPAPHSR